MLIGVIEVDEKWKRGYWCFVLELPISMTNAINKFSLIIFQSLP
jgi:hypothetical protein